MSCHTCILAKHRVALRNRHYIFRRIFMGMFDGLLQQLENSPIVQKTVEDFKNIQRVLVATVNRFDERFGVLDAKADRIIYLLEHGDKTIVPAGDDGLMKLLGESDEE